VSARVADGSAVVRDQDTAKIALAMQFLRSVRAAVSSDKLRYRAVLQHA
jgi:hypothetical protein